MKSRVLIVDDDPAVRESVAKVLRESGYDVSTAADGEEATLKLVPDQTDLVLLDLALPCRRGWDVFKSLATRLPSIPVIIITGMPDQYKTALAAGVRALIEKPIEVPALLSTIEELLADPGDARLQGMCGHQGSTKYLRKPRARSTGTWESLATTSRQRCRPNGVARWNEA